VLKQHFFQCFISATFNKVFLETKSSAFILSTLFYIESKLSVCFYKVTMLGKLNERLENIQNVVNLHKSSSVK
jgi:hypothetical protein